MKKLVAVAICVLTIFSVSVNCFAMETMKKGSRGDSVREVQEMLISLGYLDGEADGIFGSKTEGAVQAWQKDDGLETTGMVDEETNQALQKRLYFLLGIRRVPL